MRLGHFDLNLFIALDALLETKSVTKASERLHLAEIIVVRAGVLVPRNTFVRYSIVAPSWMTGDYRVDRGSRARPVVMSSEPVVGASPPPAAEVTVGTGATLRSLRSMEEERDV